MLNLRRGKRIEGRSILKRKSIESEIESEKRRKEVKEGEKVRRKEKILKMLWMDPSRKKKKR